MNDIAARRYGRCLGAVPEGSVIAAFHQCDPSSGVVAQERHLLVRPRRGRTRPDQQAILAFGVAPLSRRAQDLCDDELPDDRSCDALQNVDPPGAAITA